MAGEATLVNAADGRRLQVEDDLAHRGLWLPVEHTRAWLRAHPGDDSWVLVLTDVNQAVIGAIALSISHTRAMPYHPIVRAERVGASFPSGLTRVAICELVRIVRRSFRALRLELDLYALDDETRSALIEELPQHGFRPAEVSRCYVRTLAVDLRATPEALFENLHRSLRKQLRQLEAGPHRVASIVDPAFADRIDALHRETMERTAGSYAPLDWRQHIAFSAANPEQSHINGLFLDGQVDVKHLAAVRWCVRQGDHVQDYFAASTRGPKVPMMAAAVWGQLLWARRAGAVWFDFGGVPDQPLPQDHPLERIAEFKRKFPGREVVVGGHWSLVLSPLRNRVAAALHSVAIRLGDLRGR